MIIIVVVISTSSHKSLTAKKREQLWAKVGRAQYHHLHHDHPQDQDQEVKQQLHRAEASSLGTGLKSFTTRSIQRRYSHNVCVCVGGVGGTVDETKSSCVLHINISSWLCLFSVNFWTIFLLQVDRKKHKGGNMAVGLFNPMRFLHSIETWKKEETEV